MLGRDFEIRQIVDILMRRRQNNPILTGEAGVGKTAVVEGFALRIAEGDVPPPLKNVTRAHARPGAAAGRRGREGRVREPAEGLIDEVKASPTPIILFIDEAHTMIGAGGAGRAGRRGQPAQAGAGARRAAHDRRHDVGRVQEVLREGPRAGAPLPGGEGRRADAKRSAMRDDARRGRRCWRSTTTCAFSTRGCDAAVQALAPLSPGPAAARQGGERARHGLRAAGARPERDAAGDRRLPRAQLDDLRGADARPRARERRWARITRSGWRRSPDAATPAESAAGRAEGALGEGDATWSTEIREVRGKLEAGAPRQSGGGRRQRAAAPAARPMRCARNSAQLNAELDALQGETPLMRVCVDAQIVGEVVSGWTGIPVGKMVQRRDRRPCSSWRSTSARA